MEVKIRPTQNIVQKKVDRSILMAISRYLPPAGESRITGSQSNSLPRRPLPAPAVTGRGFDPCSCKATRSNGISPGAQFLFLRRKGLIRAAKHRYRPAKLARFSALQSQCQGSPGVGASLMHVAHFLSATDTRPDARIRAQGSTSRAAS